MVSNMKEDPIEGLLQQCGESVTKEYVIALLRGRRVRKRKKNVFQRLCCKLLRSLMKDIIDSSGLNNLPPPIIINNHFHGVVDTVNELHKHNY